jgi:hypothetical protein
MFIERIIISSTFNFELTRLLRIGRETIFRRAINGVKNLTAATVNVLLMTTFQFELLAVELPQFVHIFLQYIHDAFNSKHVVGRIEWGLYSSIKFYFYMDHLLHLADLSFNSPLVFFYLAPDSHTV